MICVLVLWARLTTVLVHICSRTPCLQTRLVKRRSRKCTDVTRGQSQFEFSCRQASRRPAYLCWYPRRAPIKHQSTYPGLVPGKRLRITPSVFSGNFGPAQGGDYQMDSAEVMWVCPLYAHCDWPLSTSGLAIGVPSRLWNVAQCQLNAYREVAFKQRRRHLPKAILIQSIRGPAD